MISVIEKTAKEVGELFLKQIRDDSIPIKMPYELEDEDVKIFINKYDNGECCVSVLTKDINGETFFGHIIIKKGVIFLTEDIKSIDETLLNVPGINPNVLLLKQSLILHNGFITSDEDFLSLLYILNEMVNYNVNKFKKTEKPQIMDATNLDYIVEKDVMVRIKLNTSDNILKAFLPENYNSN